MTPGFRGHVGDRCAQDTQVLARDLGRAGGWHHRKVYPWQWLQRAQGSAAGLLPVLPRAATSCQE